MSNEVFIKTENIEEPSWICNVKSFMQDVMTLTEVQDWDVSICFCDDEFIKNLNKQYRSIDDATDVLSFELESEYEGSSGETRYCAGDIVISISALERNTENFGVSKNDELKRLLVHGFLHLSGLDHGEYHIGKDGYILDKGEKVPIYKDLDENAKSECDMLVLQEEILVKLGDKTITD